MAKKKKTQQQQQQKGRNSHNNKPSGNHNVMDNYATDIPSGNEPRADPATGTNIPPAPYPPFAATTAQGSSSLRSNLASKPLYGTSTATNVTTSGLVAGEMTDDRGMLGNNPSGVLQSHNKASPPVSRMYFAPQIAHCPPLLRSKKNPLCLLATINCQQQSQEASNADPTASNKNGTTGTTLSSSVRKQGKVLLELRKVQFYQPKDDNGLLDTSQVVAQSRSNPSLGNLQSTCLSVLSSAASTADQPQTLCAATGLSTGALCIHTFGLDDDDGDNNKETLSVLSTDYYHTSRHHRPATAVAWRPTLMRHVALGLVSGTATVATGPSNPSGNPTSAAPVPSTVTAAMSTTTSSGTGGGLSGANAATVGTSGRRNIGVTGGAGVGGKMGSATTSGMGARTGGGSGGDREYCCFIWDVEHQAAGGGRRNKSTPLFRLSHQTGVASLAWLLEGGQTLAVGGQMRNLQLYDLRIKAQQAPISVYAHNFGVHGIEPDPTRPWQFATFCRAANEPVKIWDSRRMDSVLSEVKVSGASKDTASSFLSNRTNASIAVVSAVKWSALESGRLAIAVGDAIHEYETGSSTRTTHLNTVYARQPILDFCIYPFAPTSGLLTPDDDGPSHELRTEEDMLAEFFPRRFMVVNNDHTIHDMARQTVSPVAISRRDGRLVHAFGRALWVGSTSDGPAAMESLKIDPNNEDISATMMRRARCQHVARYSMDTASNIKIIKEDGILADKTAEHGGSLPPLRRALLRLWSWIDRVESLCAEAEDIWGEATALTWPARGLIDSGPLHLLGIDDDSRPDDEVFSEALSCMTYESMGRRYDFLSRVLLSTMAPTAYTCLFLLYSAALASCGWAGKFDLENVLGECEDLGEYERSAALAIWHGNIGAAVEALERGSSYIRGQIDGVSQSAESKKTDRRFSARYAETLDLVSLSIAGYRGDNGAASNVWRRACSNLLQREDLMDITSGHTAYLRSILKFLMAIGTEGTQHREVLGDDSLSLCDRVAFACRFLPRNELNGYVMKCIDTCQRSGDCEGVTITGVEIEGVKILQEYVDKYADVQTAALVTSRVIFPPDWTYERGICLEWLDAYRSLLNTWQMWQSRAMLDVDRAELLRKVKSKTMGGYAGVSSGQVGGKQAGFRRMGTPGSRKLSGARHQLDPDVQASVPAQLDARCNYCSSPLGLKNQDTRASQGLSKMKPILSCCPQCRKPLPRCAICMLSLGTLNPYMELTKTPGTSRSTTPGGKQQPTRTISSGSNMSGGSNQGQPADDLSSLASLPFAEWFTWCMRCKHGGHAHHIIGWFANHEHCPVSGCDCKCQFDGVQKLNRPALTARKMSQSASITQAPEETVASSQR